jgi:hypothetical protein
VFSGGQINFGKQWWWRGFVVSHALSVDPTRYDHYQFWDHLAKHSSEKQTGVWFLLTWSEEAIINPTE